MTHQKSLFPPSSVRTVEDLLREERAKSKAMRTLLLKIGWVLEQPCWRTYGALATLRNDIKDLIGE